MGLGTETLGFRTPSFDVKVEVQRRNAYTRQSQNDLALQLYNLGFFRPEQAESALGCLEMMDFEGKEGLTERLSGGAAGGLRERVYALLSQYDPENAGTLVKELFSPEGAGRTDGLPSGENPGVTAARAFANRAAETEI